VIDVLKERPRGRHEPVGVPRAHAADARGSVPPSSQGEILAVSQRFLV
jgi:hypothetical protein